MLLLLLCACGESRHEGTQPGPIAGAGGAAGNEVAATGGAAGASLGGTAGAPLGGIAGGTAGLAGAAAGTGPVTLPPLDIRAPTQLATCEPTQCNVVSDWDALEIGAGEFVDFHVAASSDVTYVTMEASYGGADYHRRIVALDASGSRAIPQGDLGSTTPLLLAVDRSGAPHVLGLGASTSEAVLTEAWLTDAGWESSTIDDGYVPNGFEIGSDDKPTAFYSDRGTGLALAVREDASWNKTTLPQTGLGRFTLGSDAQPLFLSDHAPANAPGSESSGVFDVLDATGATLFSETMPFPNAYLMPADALPRATSSGAELAALVELSDGLHLMLADQTGSPLVDTLVPDTVTPTSPCPMSAAATSASIIPGAECAPPCSFSGAGLVSGPAFAVARTTDGTLWLAYATSVFSVEYHYTWACGPTGCSNCNVAGTNPQRVSTLHILDLQPGATAFTDAVSVELEGFVVPGQDDAWAIRARGFEQRVAVAVAQRTADDELGVRVLTLETAK